MVDVSIKRENIYVYVCTHTYTEFHLKGRILFKRKLGTKTFTSVLIPFKLLTKGTSMEI